MGKKPSDLWAYLLAGGFGLLVWVLLRGDSSEGEPAPSPEDVPDPPAPPPAPASVDPDTVEAPGTIYKPGSPKQVALFKKAAAVAGLPEAWASDSDFQQLLGKESGGKVGLPNYKWAKYLGTTAGTMWATPSMWAQVWQVIRDGNAKPSYTGIGSHAAGLGQLQPSAMVKFQPNGLQGVGIPLEEAVGMLRYIDDRYSTPAAAWSFWQAKKAATGTGWY